MSERSYLAIVSHYEDCLRRYTDGARAVDWKSEEDAALRYDVMLDLIGDRTTPASLLDFGCGLAALKKHLESAGFAEIKYTGLELSPQFAEAARRNHPDTDILQLDVLEGGVLTPFDYVVMNGIFTRRDSLSCDAMTAYLHRLLEVVFGACRIGLAFNVMSKAVDWESEALFHPDPGALIAFIGTRLTRHFVLRNDYGLHETTFYLYRQPSRRRLAFGTAAE